MSWNVHVCVYGQEVKKKEVGFSFYTYETTRLFVSVLCYNLVVYQPGCLWMIDIALTLIFGKRAQNTEFYAQIQKCLVFSLAL